MDAQLPASRLIDQHRRIDEGVEALAGGSGEPAALVASLGLLREHLYLEEAVLFPPLAAAGLAMPVFVMQREHGQMWPLLEGLAVACAAGADADALRADTQQLLQLLKIHNIKEEQVLYAAADRHEAAHPEASLVAALSQARMPEGWACAMARR